MHADASTNVPMEIAASTEAVDVNRALTAIEIG
jgi:hypothetical protein